MENEQRIIEDLSVPILSYRLHAIEQALHEGSSQALLEALEARLPLEENEECRSLIGFAVQQVRRRLPWQIAGGGESGAPVASAPAVFPGPTGGGAVRAEVAGQALSPDETSADASLKALAQDFLSLAASDQVSFLAQLHRRGVAGFLEQGKTWLEAGCEPAVTSLLLRIFAPKFPKGSLGLLDKHLVAASYSVRATALSLLLQLDPERLRDRLPALLESDDAGIRAMAIQGLATLDPDEAINHCALMLRDSSPVKRQAALKVVVHLPPASTRDPLLGFVVVEKDLKLLRQAALNLQFNPDKQLPYQLWEIIERCSGEKAEILKDALRETCRNLHLSGLIEEGEDQFFRRLQTWIKLRNLRNYLQGVLQQIDIGAGFSPGEVVERLYRAAPPEMVTHVLAEARTWPLGTQGQGFLAQLATPPGELEIVSRADPSTPTGTHQAPSKPQPRVRSGSSSPSPSATPGSGVQPPRPPVVTVSPTPTPDSSVPLSVSVDRGLEPIPAKTASSSTPAAAPHEQRHEPLPPPDMSALQADPAWVSFQQLAADEQIQRLTNWPADDRDTLVRLLRAVLPGDHPKDVLAAGLRAALRLRVEGFFLTASDWLSSPDENLCSAAIEYVGWLDKDRVLFQIGKLLSNCGLRAKAATIRVLQSIDSGQAVSAIRAMLAPDHADQHEAGLACLVHLDFCLVRAFLAEFLASPISDQAFAKGLVYFRLNPDKENLPHLIRLEKAVSLSARIDATRAAREGTEAFLLDEKLIDQAELTALHQETMAKMLRERAKGARPGGSAAPMARKREAAPPAGKLDQLREWVGAHLAATLAVMVVGLIVLAVALWFAFGAWS